MLFLQRCSYSNDSRSAAFHLGTDIPLTNGSFAQYVGDNVDHNLATLDGSNTFHGMGMIAAITPGIKNELAIPKAKVSSADIINKSNIEVTYFKAKQIPKDTTFTKLMLNSIGADRTHNMDILWKIGWFLKPLRPLYNGFMQTTMSGEHPGKSSIAFLPIIDMPASNESCILTTLHFIYNHAKNTM